MVPRLAVRKLSAARFQELLHAPEQLRPDEIDAASATLSEHWLKNMRATKLELELWNHIHLSFIRLGCSRCRWSSKGCIRCNPTLAERAKFRKVGEPGSIIEFQQVVPIATRTKLSDLDDEGRLKKKEKFQ